MATVPPALTSHDVPRWRLGEHPWLGDVPAAPAAARVIVDNDFAGDPDDLFQLVHHVLSPSVEIPLVVSSHLRHDHDGASATSAADGVRVVEREPEELAAPHGGLHPPAGQTALEVGGSPAVPGERAIIEHLDTGDARTRDGGFESGPDDLDLGKLRHGR